MPEATDTWGESPFAEFAARAQEFKRYMHEARHDARYRGRHGGPAGPGGGGPAFGRGPFGPGRRFPFAFFGGGRRAGRGDIRAAILALLAEQPMHGYQIIQELESRSQGAWRPSPGSVYPTLQQLEDEGLVKPVEQGGRRVFELTEAGEVEAKASVQAPPWEEAADSLDTDWHSLRDLLKQVAAATWQVGQAGTAKQMVAASDVLRDTRRRLYQLLAEDAETEG